MFNIGDDLRNTEKYVEIARTRRYPMWPAFVAIGGMLAFAGLLALSMLSLQGQ